MDRAAKLVRTGDKIVSWIGILFILLLFSYGGYSLYDNWLINQGGSSSELMKFKPGTESSYSLAELMNLNSDVIAWITIDDTNIDQPVTQGKDDLEYINKDALKNFSLSGAIFLSCLNNRDFSDPYVLTYGHHMENGGMYGDVTEFLDEGYFNSHTSGKLTGASYEWDIELFSVLKTNGSDSMVYNPEQYFGAGTSTLQNYLKENAMHQREIGLGPDDQIIALSTCYDTETNGRVILFGRLNNKREVTNS